MRDASPDIVCLQELKAPDARFPVKEIESAGYGAIWHGQKSWNGVAILARGREPILTRKGLPGDSDIHSRYIEAAVEGMVIGCLYLPNGNPSPGPKYDYKLEWFKRLTMHAADMLKLGVPVVMAGDYNVIPTELDVYKPERWVDDALFRVEVRDAYRTLIRQGWTDALRKLNPDERIYTFWDYSAMPMGGTPACGLITCCSVHPLPSGSKALVSTGMSGDGSTPAITLRSGLNLQRIEINKWRLQ